MKKNVKDIIFNHIFIIFFILSLISIGYLICNYDLLAIYIEKSFNNIILTIFGSLLGLLLTSYAILFGLIPMLSKNLLKTKAISKVNNQYITSILLNIFVIIVGIIFIFTEYEYLIYIQLYLVIFLMLIYIIIVTYLYYLFKIMKQEKIK